MRKLLGLMLLLALSACGGGGGDAGSPVLGGGSGGSGGSAAASVADLVLVLSKPSVDNSGSQTATLTVTAVDASRKALAGVPVTLAANANAVLQSSATATGQEGTLSATVSIGSDLSPRTITVTATSGAITRSVDLLVLRAGGTTTADLSDLVLVLSKPSIYNTGAETATLTVTAVDASRKVLAGVPVTVSADANAVVSTSGSATAADGTVTATVSAGSDLNPRTITLSASAGAITRTLNLSVIRSGSEIAAAVSDLVVFLNKSSIYNSGGEAATLTVTAVDAGRKVLAGVPVQISADANAVVRTNASVTGPDGSVTALVTVGSDLTPRTITLTAVAGSVTRKTSLAVTGVIDTQLPTLALEISSTTISAASPATVTALLRDGKGQAVAGQVVSFATVRGMAVTNAPTALTGADGRASVVLSPASSSVVGADEVVASAALGGSALQVSRGFQVQATDVSITAFTSATASLSAYGQTAMTIGISGVSLGSPVQMRVTSSCVALGKATVSPSSFTATAASVTLQFQDNGCGAVQASDQLQVSIVGSTASRSLVLPIAAPSASSIGFVRADPEVIYLKGTGLTESSQVTFVVRDAAGNPLPNRAVVTQLLAPAGGATLEGGTAAVTRESDAEGRVSVRINSGTVPGPVRVAATLQGTAISTVSSNLSVAVGLPSQLNFSLSQATKNIEAMNIDGTANTYQVIASDRNGNPVPAGTSINFIAEGGQVEAIRQIVVTNGLGRASANFLSSEPRPADGRVTVIAYALGEESFIDLNGNNVYDEALQEPFQDLGDIFKDRNFDGVFDPLLDESIPLPLMSGAPRVTCVASANPLLALNASIPSVLTNCNGKWSGAGTVYVRRAIETVFSTSTARPLWPVGEQSAALCPRPGPTLQVSPSASQAFNLVSGSTWYAGSTTKSGVIQIVASDANGVRLNPVAAGTVITVSATQGLTATVDGGSPVPSTLEATRAVIGFGFDDTTTSGSVTINFKSPGGLVSAAVVNILKADKPALCP